MLRRESTKACGFGFAAQQASHAGDEVHASIEQEPALVLWRLPPGGLDVLRAFLDAGLHAHAEIQDFAKLSDTLGATPRESSVSDRRVGCDVMPGVLLEGVEVTELLSNSEEDFALVDVAAVPLDQFASRRNVLCDRLLGQDMLACAQGLLDVCWLSRNRQSNYNSLDV